MNIFYLIMALIAIISAVALANETDNQAWYFLILPALYLVGAAFCN